MARKVCFAGLVVLLSPLLAGQVPGQTKAPAAAAPKEPYIAVTSFTVHPVEIHKSRRPREAIVTVKVSLYGRMPPHATALVDVGTAMADPPLNNVAYSRDLAGKGPAANELTLPLRHNPTIFRFRVRWERKTAAGSVMIEASIVQATKGVSFRTLRQSATVWMKTAVP